MMLGPQEHNTFRLLISRDWGTKSIELAQHLGTSQQRAHEILRALKTKGYVRSGGGLWHAIRTAPKYGINGEQPAQEQAEYSDDGHDSMPIVRAFRGVGEWTAGAITAPTSVFDLARVA